MTVPWILFGVGLGLAVVTTPALVAVQHWVLLFPTFFASWLGSGLAAWWLVLAPAATITLVAMGGLAAWPGWIGLAFSALAIGGLVSQWRRARAGVRAFDEALSLLELEPRRRLRRTPRSIILPMSMRSRAVERIKGLRYAEGSGARHLLDIHRPAAGTEGAPVLLQIHGGAWMIGTKNTQGRPLMNALAAAGWVCVAINYRLSPRAKFPDHLVDCKLAIAWIREHIAEYGGDPGRIVVTGGSAGGHLAAMVALTANDPEFQPGFEAVDTSVVASIPIYGAYDLEELFTRTRSRLGRRVSSRMGHMVVGAHTRTSEARAAYRAASPVHHVGADAPPFLLLHGTIDNLVPISQARRFAALLQDAGVEAVLIELPGAPHAFDVFHSTWADTAVDGVVRYLGRLPEIVGAGSAGSTASTSTASTSTATTSTATTPTTSTTSTTSTAVSASDTVSG